MWCPSRFSSWSFTVYLVHYPSKYSYFTTFLEPSSLFWRHTTFLLFLSICFDASITRLRYSLQHISSWMTANLLTLNSSKTEFLLIGLPLQLAKLIPAHWLLLTLLVTLLLSLTNTSLSLTKSALSKSCYYHILELRCLVLILTSKPLVPSPLLSFILTWLLQFTVL